VIVVLIYPMAKYPLIPSRLLTTDVKVYRTACAANERLHALSILLCRLSSIPSLLFMKQIVLANLLRCMGFDYKSKTLGKGPVL
jgi:hypothetical protein